MARKTKVKAPPGRRGGAGGTKRSGTTLWTLGVAAAVILGIILVVTSRGERSNIDTSAGTPINAHWHAAFGFYVCGEWKQPPPELQPLPDPHTHADALMHSEPLSRSSAYRRATFGRFATEAGWSLSETKIDLDWIDEEFENGDKCENLDDEPGVVQWKVNGKPRTGDPAEYIITDGDIVVVAFMPEGEEFPDVTPDGAAKLQDNGSPVNYTGEKADKGKKKTHATTTTAPETTTTEGEPAGS